VANISVVGYSFGAAVGLRAGGRDERVRALVGVALPLKAMDASFLTSCAKPKLLVAGARDPYCPLSELEDLLRRCPEPKALAVVGGADHFFWGKEAEVAQATAAFLSAIPDEKT
jgi:hypothetical protein